MDRCVSLLCSYCDTDAVELRVYAWNGRFGGAAQVWVGQGELADVATQLMGFPASLEDKREVTFGAFGPKFAGGALTLRFSCIDGAGHCQLLATIEAEYGSRDSFAERVEMSCEIEPAALDQFVGQLRELNSSLTGKAMLSFSEP